MMQEQVAPIAQYGLVAVSIVVIVLIGVVANAIIRRTLKKLSERQILVEPLHVMLRGITWWTIVIVVILMILQQAGVRVVGLWAGLLTVAGMVTIGFIAVWSVLSNILCAVLLIVFAPFRIGDDIEIIEATGGKGLRGKVVNLNILYTSIEEVTEEGTHEGVTYVPNNIFFQKTIRQWQGTHTTPLDANLFKESSSEAAPTPEARSSS
jgi:small-conductance mechanosensitive channel